MQPRAHLCLRVDMEYVEKYPWIGLQHLFLADLDLVRIGGLKFVREPSCDERIKRGRNAGVFHGLYDALNLGAVVSRPESGCREQAQRTDAIRVGAGIG